MSTQIFLAVAVFALALTYLAITLDQFSRKDSR